MPGRPPKKCTWLVPLSLPDKTLRQTRICAGSTSRRSIRATEAACSEAASASRRGLVSRGRGRKRLEITSR